jgi:antitoxin ParD1/3/4
MATVEKMSIALPSEMANLVRQAVEDGQYSSSSEVVREALRDWSERRNQKEEAYKNLRSLWRQAIQSGKAADSPEVVFARVKKRLVAKASAQ